MEIIETIGQRSYIFYSQEDLTKARSLWIKLPWESQEDFENALEEANIDYVYNLGG